MKKEQDLEIEATPEERGQRFQEITKELIKVGTQYEEISPDIKDFYMDALLGFIKAQKLVYNHSNVSEPDAESKIIIFEQMFDINISEEVEKMAKDIITNIINEQNTENIKDNNINKINTDLLDNIKKNINKYLKD